MADAAGAVPPSVPATDLKVLSVAHFEASPPANLAQDLVDPEGTFATTKEEEWVTKKKTELTTTRQIETRVKRQVVLEDGKVVEDTGPIVTTNTTEDTEKQESKQTERRTTGDDPPGEDWVAASGPGGTVKEVKERKVTSREQKEERVETEDVQHLGDISDDAYQAAVRSQQDLRLALHLASPEPSGQVARASSPRIVHQSSKSHKVVDTEDSQQLSQVQPDGRLVTETRRTTEHEEIDDTEEPDGADVSDAEETLKESSHRYAKTKDQELVEYLADGVKIGEEMRYVAENVEGERRGDPADLAMAEKDWDSLSTRIRRMRRQSAKARGIPAADPAAPVPLDRKDALTKKPLDFDQEEETRKVETSKWLEHHFGSDSRSSKDSLEDDDLPPTGTNTSFINVTMKSRPISSNRKMPSVTSPVNGAATPAKAYVATVNTSSRVFVSSPEPEETQVNGAGGFFQGVSEWSERRNEVKSPSPPQRPDRVQVLPSGPHHTFAPKSPAEASSPPSSSNHIDRSSPYPSTNHVSEKSTLFQSTASHNVSSTVGSRASPYLSNSLLSAERNASYVTQNGHHGRSSPYQQNSSDRASPYPNGTEKFPYNGAVRPEREHLESPSHLRPAQDRAHSPYQQNSSDRASPYPNGTEKFPYNGAVRPEREHRESQYQHKSGGVSDDGYHPSRRRSPPQRLRFSDREEHKGEEGADGYRYHSTYRSPLEKEAPYRLWDRKRQREPLGDDGSQEAEPPPDYSPPPAQAHRSTPSPSPSPPPESATSKKLYRRPRVAADIPPASNAPAPRPAKSSGHSATSIIGESFRKLVGKFRTSSSERKNKQQRRKRGSSRSPSPDKARVGRRGGDRADSPLNEAGDPRQQPVAPPRSARAQHRSERSTQTMQRRGASPVVHRFYLGEDPFGGSIYGREREYDGVTPVKSGRRHNRPSGHRRGSHPGEEEDMNRANVSSSSLGRLSKSTSRLTPGATVDYSRSAQTLPRKLYDDHQQTSRLKKQVYLQRNGAASKATSGSMINVSIINNVTPPTSSIGVSNGLGEVGPAKPARTYRSNLARSKSFNVHAGGPGDSPSFLQGNSVYTSNPHLHRLEESPPPLKSPGILASISRSQRDLSQTAAKEEDFGRRQEQLKFSKSTNSITNGYGGHNHLSNGSAHDAKKKVFLRELMDRAPELYKTLHGAEEVNELKHAETSRSPAGRMYSSTPLKNGVLDYNNSFRSSSTNATPPMTSPYRGLNGIERVTSPSGSKSSFNSSLRRGSSSNDDYSETVRITSKSDDPLRPSVTNTVQSFSKKTLPTKGGRSTETIESSETTTVTKSRSRGGGADTSVKYLDNAGSKYGMRNGGGGVVIEVRPSRK